MASGIHSFNEFLATASTTALHDMCSKLDQELAQIPATDFITRAAPEQMLAAAELRLKALGE